MNLQSIQLLTVCKSMGSNHEDGTMGDENQESCRVNENELLETLTGK